ncbi:calcyphosin-like protein [Ostrinia furnacalis]|uniref:calcyphosin-like protein n=1 Tax=Ostrinia furnacalis TaxID=93504 RepID=UPI0010393AD0|nr:calcyphosin-like protein [Ostrinia furnacalis]
MVDDMYLGKAKTSSNIAWHRPMSTTFREEEELMNRCSRALDSATDPLEKLRLLCLSHGAAGIMALARAFRRMEIQGNKRLNRDEFVESIKETGLDFSDEDAMELFTRFDKDDTGYIVLEEFLSGIRPPMSDSRRAIVEQAFKKLDKTGDGVISVDDIRRVYAVTSHPRYMSGEETADLVMSRFLANFEQDGIIDGKVTREEFLNFYSGFSVSIDSDCYFDLMIRQAYKL